MDIKEIEKRFLNLKKEIETFGRDIKIVVVTKYLKDIDILASLAKIGITDIAENYAQEMLFKYNQLQQKDINIFYKWHFIGHLQKNKVKKILPLTYLIQSIDSVELAYKVNEEAKKISKVQDCLLELKVSFESTKFGIKEEEIYEVVERIKNLKNIRLLGLMTMAPYYEDPSFTRPFFKKAYNVFENIKKNFEFEDFNILSMGMSNDYKVALEEGSNMLRIGSLLFE